MAHIDHETTSALTSRFRDFLVYIFKDKYLEDVAFSDVEIFTKMSHL